MDLGRSPTSVLLCQAPDQLTNLFRDLRPSAARPGAPTPVEAETGTMRAADSGRLHDDENVRAAGEAAAQGGPEESVHPVDDGTRPFAFDHRDLLSEGEDFESSIAPTAKENLERGKECEDRVDHELTVLTWRNEGFSSSATGHRKFLIKGRDQVLATNRRKNCRSAAISLAARAG